MNKAIMKAPEGMTSLSWGGTVYNIEDGLALVPIESVQDLLDHGLTFMGDRPESEEEALTAQLEVLEARVATATQAFEDAAAERDSVKARLDAIKAADAKANGESTGNGKGGKK